MGERVSGYEYDIKTARWNDSHRWGPAPRFRRKIILGVLGRLSFSSLLDVGCAQPYLLLEIGRRFPGKVLAGLDVAESVIEEYRRKFPRIDFMCSDIQLGRPARRYDVVICSEVLEHLPEYEAALDNVRAMCGKNLLVTVPASPLFPIDRQVGHIRHFPGRAMEEALERHGFTVVWSRDWGFPFRTLYKIAINKTRPDALREAFSEAAYDRKKKLLSAVIYGLFHANLYRCGWQKIILARV